MMTDPAIIKAVARALCVHATGGERTWGFEREREHYLKLAEAVLAAVTPLIEIAALERAAKGAEDCDGAYTTRERVAAAIRTLIPPAESSAA
jgi:hypothetical protein